MSSNALHGRAGCRAMPGGGRGSTIDQPNSFVCLGNAGKVFEEMPQTRLSLIFFIFLSFVCLHLSQRANREMPISRILILLFTEELKKLSPTTTFHRSTPLGSSTHCLVYGCITAHTSPTDHIYSFIQPFIYNL